MSRTYRLLDDRFVGALWDFRDDADTGEQLYRMIWDDRVKGLRLRVGKYKATWSYFRQYSHHGQRGVVTKTLGEWPAMSTAAARKAAQVEAGRVAAGRIEPGARSAVRFEQAFADYLEHLSRKVEKKGKPPRWRRAVESLGRTILLPNFAKWTLPELSRNPAAVADWHQRMAKERGAVTANHGARVMRAVYRRAARLDRSMPPHLPTSAIEFAEETIGGQGMAFRDFLAWAEACRRIENPIHRAYHLFCLLTGTRPGEAARIRWQDVRPRERAVIISAAKAGNDIRIPMSAPIVRVLKMARDARGGGELVFPECAQRGRHDKLPARGVELRRTYRTIAADCGVDEMLAHFLMGHSPSGISQRYVARLILSSGPAMRDAQRKISNRIVQLLGGVEKLRPLEPWD